MNVHELHPMPGSRKTRKRVGRGISAGQGKTAGRGQKGQFARSGAHLPVGFEGGQMPLTQRLPKRRGFTNIWRIENEIVNVSKLNRFVEGTVVDPMILAEAGLIHHPERPVRVLGAGSLRVKLTVRAHYVTPQARAQVEACGGTVDLIEPEPEAGVPAPVASDSEPKGVESDE